MIAEICRRRRLPATLAAVTALTELYIYSRALLPLLLAAALVLRHLLPWRLPAGTLSTWITRIVLLGFSAAHGIEAGENVTGSLFNPSATLAVGLVFSTEMVLQGWQDEGPPASAGLLMLAFSSGVALMASNMPDLGALLWLHPLYILVLWQALRQYALSAAPAPSLSAAPALAAAALAMLLVGSGAAFVLQANKEQLMAWSEQFARISPARGGAGFSSSPRLGESRDVPLSTERVLRVSGLEGPTHLRGASFRTYQAGMWLPDLRDVVWESLPGRAQIIGPGKPVRFSRYTSNLGILFLPLSAGEIEGRDGEVLNWSRTAGGAVSGANSSFYSYSCRMPEAEQAQGPLAPPPYPAERARYLQLPTDIDPQVRRITAAAVAQASGPAEKAAGVVNYLTTNHTYSLTTRLQAGDPVMQFLILRKAGHCEYFASAAVLMLRLAGVPARYVTGYFANEPEPGGLVVRQRDAHAWCEAWIDGLGWITVDATPAAGVPDHAGRPAPYWQIWRERAQDAWQAMLAWLQEGRMLALLPYLLAFLVLVAAAAVWRRRRGAAPAGVRYEARDERLADLARRFEQMLRRAGYPCPETEPWTEHLLSLPREGAPLPLKDALIFVSEYNKLRFGSCITPGQLEQLAGHLRRMAETASGSGSRT